MADKRVMRFGPFKPIFFTALVAVVIVVGVSYFEQQQSFERKSEAALVWSRQIASQAEGLALEARSQGERDPLLWAVSHLNQGSEQRFFQITKVAGNRERKETFDFHADKNVFEYQKLLFPEEGSSGGAIRVKIPMADRTSGTRFLADLYKVCLFLISWLAAFGAYLWWRSGRRLNDRDLRKKVLSWTGGAQGMIAQLGESLRDVVREAHHLTQAALRSRKNLGGLRSRIQASADEIQKGRQILQDAKKACIQAEVMALNLALEVSRAGVDSPELLASAEELHRMTQKIRKFTQDSEEMLTHLGFQVAPWIKDTQEALTAYEEVFRTAQKMDPLIRETMESLLNQNQQIKSLKSLTTTDESTQSASDEVVRRRSG